MLTDRILPTIALALLACSTALAQDGGAAPAEQAPAVPSAPSAQAAPAAAPSKGFTATINADNVYIQIGRAHV